MKTLKTLTLRVVGTEPKRGDSIAFVSAAVLFEVLAGHRADLILAMAGAGQLTIRKLSRRMTRDVKGVHRDVHTLLDAGIVERREGGFLLPYDAVRVDVLLT